MGVPGFFSILGLRADRRHISEFPDWRIAMDGNIFMCKGVYAAHSQAPGQDPTHAVISGMEKLLKLMRRYNTEPILFIDGDNLPAKKETQEKRKAARAKYIQRKAQYYLKNEEYRKFQKCISKSKEPPPNLRSDLIALAQRLKIPYQVSLYEADSQCTYAIKMNDCDMVATSDSDFAVYNCRNIFFDMDAKGWGYFFTSDDIPLALEIPDEEYDPETLLKMAIIRGNDFYDGIPGIGPAKALEIMKTTPALDMDSILETVHQKFPSIFKKMPPDCKERLMQAAKTFKYSTVYDVTKKVQVLLNELPPNESKDEISQFAGPWKNAEIATNISKGLIHPKTNEPLTSNIDPSDSTSGYQKDCIWHADYQRPTDIKTFTRTTRKSGAQLGIDKQHYEDFLNYEEASKTSGYDCHICGSHLKRFHQLMSHLLVHSGKRPFECKICNKTYSRKEYLKIHSVCHTTDRPYTCIQCGESFRWRGTLYAHHAKHHGVLPYPCLLCDRAFYKRGDIINHTNVHNGVRPHQCRFEGCEKSFAQLSNLRSHVRIHMGAKPYQCQFCNKSFAKLTNLKGHERTHTGEKPYQCFFCNKSFTQASHFKDHVRIHTGEKPYQCKVCNQSFTQASTLIVHKRIHTGEKPHQCKICNKSFTDPSTLRVHKRIHTGEKPYQCKVCNQSFAKVSTLIEHKRIHTGEKPYQCKICNKSFAKASTLRDHKMIHTGEKPYQCKVCNQSFARASTLKVHQRIHTGEKPYECKFCKISFTQDSTLKRHGRLCHGEKNGRDSESRHD